MAAEYTDPPDMPETERMTDAEFRTIREFLGLTGDWLAQHLDVTSRTVRHWEQGKYPIPDGVRLAVEDLELRTSQFVAELVDKLADLPDPCVLVYRTDEEHDAAHPEAEFPASWHRAVIARVALEVIGLRIVYPTKA